MSQEFLPFTRPDVGEEEIAEVVACLRSGWIATGPRVQLLEEKFRAYLGAPHALTLSSATAGLHLALKAVGVGPGDEVITTPMTFVATLNTIVHTGATPVLVDIDPKTFNMDIGLLEKAVTPRTKAIMPVHFAGLPVDCDALYAFAKAKGLRVIEDAAHAIGAQYKGKRIGSFGDIQVFSFHPCKNMTTAEGGCLVTRDADVAKKVTQLRLHGLDRDAWNRYSKEGSQTLDVVEAGYKCNMSDLQASLGIHQIDKLDAMNEARQTHVARYNSLLSCEGGLTLPTAPDYTCLNAWHIYTPLLNLDKVNLTRDAFVAKMKEYNIGVGVHYTPVHLYSYYRTNYGWGEGSFPIAEDVGARIMSLPLWASMTPDAQDRVVEAITSILKENRR
ncbi:MAG: UDP-4-amino-4,6-dideoxy-N-acetyl-beta-L-altrosamine transaminase [Candidatus Puniceispirillum sp.]|nr:UDP-4-amino-4,6-dideoxy-N-acetyl-beta-L-altrosamine transaminase [Candidatus Puniceispirillum sp.]